MRQFLLIYFSIVFQVSFSQTDMKSEFRLSKFHRIPKVIIDSTSDYLINFIIPSKEYKYWEYVRVSLSEKEQKQKSHIIRFKGDSLNYADKVSQINSNSGIIDLICPFPAFSFDYIRAINYNDSIELIETKEKFEKFIGKVQNFEEVMFVVELNGYSYDNKKRIGSFRETTNSFYLYLLDEKNCTQEVVRAILHKSGEFIVIDKNFYKKTKPCLTF